MKHWSPNLCVTSWSYYEEPDNEYTLQSYWQWYKISRQRSSEWSEDWIKELAVREESKNSIWAKAKSLPLKPL